jgi:hypothetical protein
MIIVSAVCQASESQPPLGEEFLGRRLARFACQSAARSTVATTEGLERRIVGLVLSSNPYARVGAVQLQQRGCYFDAVVAVT